MKEHGKKMVAPIIITILIVLYYAAFAALAFYFKFPIVVCVFAVVIPAILGGVMIAVCIQRVKEIRSGEEDDLSKY